MRAVGKTAFLNMYKSFILVKVGGLEYLGDN